MLKLTPVLALLLTVSAHARLDLTSNLLFSEGRVSDYRLGDSWGKKPVTLKSLVSESPVVQRAALATAYLPIGGTAFYLGKFSGKHVIATNHHVCPDVGACVGDNADFRMLKKRFKVTRLFVTLPDVDLSLLEIRVPAKDEASLAKVAKNFAFKKQIQKGMELLTIGFGIGGNSNNDLMANLDSDCKVFSDDGDYVHMADPDEINPGYYKAWSFAHACDISHGDSGSAMVDRNTGDVVGIVWTGKIPKSKIVQKSSNLDQMFSTSSPLIWRELSFAVPSVKIGVYLDDLSEDNELDADTRSVFKALVK